jgi:restriction endonuclease S subunit
MITLRELARVLAGEISGDQVLAPGPGHSAKDRSLSVKPEPNAAGGFVCFSHANDDWQTCRDYVLSHLALPGGSPSRNDRYRRRPAPQVEQPDGRRNLACVRPYLLNIAVIESDITPMPIASTAFAVLNGFGLVLPTYQWIVLRSPFMVTCVETKMRGQAYPAINDSDFSLLPFPLPPLSEQHRIVAKVDELMTLCDRLEAARAGREEMRDRLAAASLAPLIAPDPDPAIFANNARFALDTLPVLTTRPDQVKQLRQTILTLAVRGKLVPQDAGEKPRWSPRTSNVSELEGRLDVEVPANWRWVRVEDVAHARLGKMLDKAKNKGRPYQYLRNTNVHWFNIRLDDLKTILLEEDEFEEYRLAKDDVLICEGGHGIGRTAVWNGADQDLVFQKALHRVRPGPHLNPHYFAQCCFVYFDAGIMQTYFTGVGIPHFTGRALAKLVSPLPPLAEQRRIVAKVDALMALCDRLEASLDAAGATRCRLLDALLAEALAPTKQRDAA